MNVSSDGDGGVEDETSGCLLTVVELLVCELKMTVFDWENPPFVVLPDDAEDDVGDGTVGVTSRIDDGVVVVDGIVEDDIVVDECLKEPVAVVEFFALLSRWASGIDNLFTSDSGLATPGIDIVGTSVFGFSFKPE
jgi:hypothetical protein